MPRLPFALHHSLVPLLIILLSIALYLGEPLSSEILVYDRIAIGQHQWWRLFSAHLLHTNFYHLLLNLLAVFLLWALHGQYFNQKHYLCLFLGISLGTSLGLYCFAPSLRWYVGLSGVLHGLFIVGAYFDITHQYRTSWLLLIGVWVKVIDEQLSGASDSISALIEANVAIDAHLYGTFCGSIVILGYVVKHRIKNR